MLSISLLGTPVITWDGESFELRRRQARGLLYYLAAEQKTVTRDRLQLLFWPESQEKTAGRNLTRLVSYLRHSLPQEGLLLKDGRGLVIDPNYVWCDAIAFAGQCDSDETADLEKAIDLYGGPFLDGFSLADNLEFELWLTQSQRRFEQRYLDALSRLAQAKQVEGRIDAAIAFTRRYLQVDELAEEMHRRLIDLYAAAGDRAAAQRQYERCLTILESELGVSPLPETRAVYETVMRDESVRTAPSVELKDPKTVWMTLPTMDLPLIGRREAWHQLEDAYRRHQSGGAIFIFGEPGIGKSRLLQEFALRRKERLVLAGNSQEATRDLPYQPVLQALRQALARPELWSDIPSVWLAEVTRVLPELGTTFPDLPQALNIEPQHAQARLFEALSQICLGLAARQPMLLCLDDMHWADESTIRWLNYFSGRMSGSNVCLLATYRSEEGKSLAGLRETLRRAGIQTEISLDGLSVEAIIRMLEQLPESMNLRPKTTRSHTQSLASRIHRATAGNPFFALETLRSLWESGQLASPPEKLPLPDTVQETIRERLGRLEPVGRQMLDAAAVLSPELEFEVVLQTAGRAEPEALDGVDQLLGHQIMLEGEEGLQFQHDLFQAVVYEELNPWRRRRLHRRAAEAVFNVHRRDSDGVAAQVARHYDAAGDIEPALNWYARAAEAARRLYANEEAIGFLRRAITLLPDPPQDSVLATRLYELLAGSLLITGHPKSADSAYRSALSHCPDADRLWQAELHRQLAGTYTPQGRIWETDEVFQNAVDALGSEPGDFPVDQWWQAWLSLQLARHGSLYFQDRLGEMEELAARIEPVLEQFGTRQHQLDYLAKLGEQMLRRKRFNLDLEDVDRRMNAIDIAYELGDEMKITGQEFGLGFMMLWAGQLNSAEEHLRLALAKAEAIAYLPVQNQCLVYLTILSRLSGDVTQARLVQARSMEVAKRVGAPYYVAAAEANQAWLDYRDGKWDLAAATARKALERWQGSVYPFHWLALWPLLAIALDRDNLAMAVESAASMLAPSQQRLSGELTAALEASVHHWQNNERDTSRQQLNHALELAESANYL